MSCDACEFSNHTHSTYTSSNNKSTAPFMLVHSYVWGPNHTISQFGHHWFVTFIDCYSRVTWVYLMHTKSQVFSCFKNFHKIVATQFDAKIRVLRSDNDIEYMDGAF